MMDCFALVCAEREPTRDRHIILGDLTKMIHPDFHPRIWALINELENAAWEGGCSEGYEHGFHDGIISAIRETQ